MLHWMKGTPFQLAEDQGRYDSDTFWEQIDHGRQGTVNRRIFTTVPLVLSVDESNAQGVRVVLGGTRTAMSLRVARHLFFPQRSSLLAASSPHFSPPRSLCVFSFLVASYVNHWETSTTIVNLVFLFVAVVPKLDSMDHVRIGGINQD